MASRSSGSEPGSQPASESQTASGSQHGFQALPSKHSTVFAASWQHFLNRLMTGREAPKLLSASAGEAQRPASCISYQLHAGWQGLQAWACCEATWLRASVDDDERPGLMEVRMRRPCWTRKMVCWTRSQHVPSWLHSKNALPRVPDQQELYARPAPVSDVGRQAPYQQAGRWW